MIDRSGVHETCLDGAMKEPDRVDTFEDFR